jgi:hypothetical protein
VKKPFPLITRRRGTLAVGVLRKERHDVLDQLRRIGVLVDTAAVLEQYAERVRNPAVAAALRDRAGSRRQAAEQIRADLAAHGIVVARPRPSARPATRTSTRWSPRTSTRRPAS